MEMDVFNQQKQTEMFEDDPQLYYPNIDYDCLQKYDENNRHFSMAIIRESYQGEAEQAIGYNCIYRTGTYIVKLEYNIPNGIWIRIPLESDEQTTILDPILDGIQSLTLDEQVQIIIQRYDKYFAQIDQSKTSRSNTPFKDENIIQYTNNELIELIPHPTHNSSIILEDDEQQKSPKAVDNKDAVDFGFHSFISGSRTKFSGLAPPPVAPRRSRQNSACSTQSSVRYASFLPPIPPTAPVRRRRVIESILINVHRKKKTFEKIVDVLKRTEVPTMRDLGLEFLRVYDGKFNYRQGHTFVLPFRKKTWYLTIEQINCVDCPMGEMGPRSVLILSHKGQCTKVHV